MRALGARDRDTGRRNQRKRVPRHWVAKRAANLIEWIEAVGSRVHFQSARPCRPGASWDWHTQRYPATHLVDFLNHGSREYQIVPELHGAFAVARKSALCSCPKVTFPILIKALHIQVVMTVDIFLEGDRGHSVRRTSASLRSAFSSLGKLLTGVEVAGSGHRLPNGGRGPIKTDAAPSLVQIGPDP
jgi:hypothetical protein